METNENFEKMRREVMALSSWIELEASAEIVHWHMARVARLGGLREVSEAIQKSRQYTWNLSHKPGFPEPMHSVHATPLWDVEDVREAFRNGTPK